MKIRSKLWYDLSDRLWFSLQRHLSEQTWSRLSTRLWLTLSKQRGNPQLRDELHSQLHTPLINAYDTN